MPRNHKMKQKLQQITESKDKAAKISKKGKNRKQTCMVNQHTDQPVALDGKIGLEMKTSKSKKNKNKKKKNAKMKR